MAAFFELKVNQKYLGEMSRLVPSVAERKGRWWGGGGERGWSAKIFVLSRIFESLNIS